MLASDHVDVVELLKDPSKVVGLTCEQIPALLTQLSTLQAAMAVRLISGNQSQPSSDTLLNVDEAAARLGVSADWLYRRTKALPFVVRVGRHVMFSTQGIDRYIKRQMGR